MTYFDFEDVAVNYYNHPNNAKAAEAAGVLRVDDYAELTYPPVSRAAAAAIQHAASKQQALFLEQLSTKFDTDVFEGLFNIGNTSSTTSKAPSSSTTKNAAEVRQVIDIKNKLSSMHRKTDNLVNHPGQQGAQGISGSLTKIFDKMDEVRSLADPDQHAFMTAKTKNHVQREFLNIFIKLEDGLCKVAFDEEGKKDVKAMIMKKQCFVSGDVWEKDFVKEYKHIMETTGSADARVKNALHAVAENEKAVAKAAADSGNGATPLEPVPSTIHVALKNGAQNGASAPEANAPANGHDNGMEVD